MLVEKLAKILYSNGMDVNKESLKLHKKLKGKLEVVSKAKVNNVHDLSLAYTPGVAAPCREIAAKKKRVYDYTFKGRVVAVVTDGSAVLGLGNIGPEAALPVMEGKAVLFKEFAGVDAWPICLDTQDADEIIHIVEKMAPGFGGINLEDISAPRCFYIEEELKKRLSIPVFHDDQHGTAIVALAGLINALKVVKKRWQDIRIVVSGAGAGGIAVTKMLLQMKPKDILLLDSRGIIYQGRKQGMNLAKEEIARITNKKKLKGGLKEAMAGADVFIGVSQPNIATKEMVKSMNKESIVFAMSNPKPEIMPDLARQAGAKVVATGRSDFPNQINNVLAFPGIFKGVFESGKKQITEKMKLKAAKALANMVKKPTAKKIIPAPFECGVADVVARAVKSCS